MSIACLVPGYPGTEFTCSLVYNADDANTDDDTDSSLKSD